MKTPSKQWNDYVLRRLDEDLTKKLARAEGWHPDDETLALFAMGYVEEIENPGLVDAHIADCDYCADRAAEYQEAIERSVNNLRHRVAALVAQRTAQTWRIPRQSEITVASIDPVPFGTGFVQYLRNIFAPSISNSVPSVGRELAYRSHTNEQTTSRPIDHDVPQPLHVRFESGASAQVTLQKAAVDHEGNITLQFHSTDPRLADVSVNATIRLGDEGVFPLDQPGVFQKAPGDGYVAEIVQQLPAGGPLPADKALRVGRTILPGLGNNADPLIELIELIQDRERVEAERVRAVKALSLIGGNDVIQALRSIPPEDAAVYDAVIEALGRLRSEFAIPLNAIALFADAL
jgi:hypothetical protein